MENIEMKNILLSIKNLDVEYTSEKRIIHAVNGVSLDVLQGETLGLVGETGAGKTTIAKSILRILPDRAATIKDGEVIFDSRDLLKLKTEDMQRIRGVRISMVFQDPMTSLNPIKTIGSQVSSVIALHKKVKKEAAWRLATELLAMVGITEDRMFEYPHQFSGGMKQRVIIAMALACDPDLLIADEPTTALDVTIQAQVLDMVRALKKEKNTSMILITHDLGIVAENCDTVAIIYAGEIVEYGSKEDIFDRPSHPYTIGLFGAIPDLEIDTEWLEPIVGLPPDPSNLPSGCAFHPRCPYVSDDCVKDRIDMISIEGLHMCSCLNIDSVAARRK